MARLEKPRRNFPFTEAPARGDAVRPQLDAGELAVPAEVPAGAGSPDYSEPLDLAIARLRAELDATERELTVSAFRVEGERGPGRRTFCDAYPLADIESEHSFLRRIRNDWGAGRFRLICHDGKGLVLNREVTLAPVPSDARPASGASPELVELRDLVRQLAARDSEEAVLARLRTYREIFGPPPAAGGGGGGFIEGVKFARELAGGHAKPGEMVGELLALVNGARELAEGLGRPGGEDAPDSLVGVGLELLRTIKAVSGASGGAPQPAVALPAPMLAPSPPLPESPSGVPPNGAPGLSVEQAAQLAAIRRGLDGLLMWAQVDASPDPVADLVYEQIPDELLDYLLTPQWFDGLVELVPEVANHREWFATVRDAVLAIWRADPEAQHKPAHESAPAGAS